VDGRNENWRIKLMLQYRANPLCRLDRYDTWKSVVGQAFPFAMAELSQAEGCANMYWKRVSRVGVSIKRSD